MTKFNLSLTFILLLSAIAFVLFLRPVFAQQASAGLCYSISGSTVETTAIGEGAYPFDVRVDVRDVPGGVEVVHRAVWVEVPLRTWLPVISR